MADKNPRSTGPANADATDLESIVLLRSELLAGGMDDNAIRRAVRRGDLVRVRHGSYATEPGWSTATPVRQHLLLARSVLARSPIRLALSHQTAVVAHGGPDYGLDLTDVHVARLDRRSGRREAGVAQHRGVLTEADVVSRHGLACTSPLRSALEVMTTHSSEVGLVVANDFIHRGLVTADALRAAAAVQGIDRWPGSLAARAALALSGPGCESVGESRLVHLIHVWGLPAPVRQYVVRDRDGRIVARLDLAWPELGVWVEFDGRGKYLAATRPGRSVADVVLEEKAREDLVRELKDWRCVRVVWPDLYRPETTAVRLGRALGVTPIRPAPHHQFILGTRAS